MAEVDTFVRIASFAYQIAGNKAVEWKSQIQAIELDKTYPGTIYIYIYPAFIELEKKCWIWNLKKNILHKLSILKTFIRPGSPTQAIKLEQRYPETVRYYYFTKNIHYYTNMLILHRGRTGDNTNLACLFI